MASKNLNRNLLSVAAALTLAVTLGGCTNVMQDAKNLGDYLNLRNGLLDPSQVGRFDKGNPWGVSKPVTWPILETLDAVDEPNLHWTTATDPLPSDLIVETKEYVVGQGDYINVTVFELVTPGLPYQEQRKVDELGNIRLQNVGSVHVEGLSPSQIEEKIGQIAVERGFLLPKGNGSPGPQVNVQLAQSQARIFSVLGQVGSPGLNQILTNDFRMLDAIAVAKDISGGVQPGLDYLYVIRAPKGAGVMAPAATQSTPPATAPGADPLKALDTLKPSSAVPTTPPQVAAASDMPVLIRELPKAMVTLSDNPTLLAQADLDAAIGGGARPAAATTPAASAAAPATSGAPATPPTTGEALMNQASGAAKPGMIFLNGQWVQVAPAPLGMSPDAAQAAATGLSAPRVIRIPIVKLLEGDPRYNIVIQPGDVIRVPNIEPGEFYFMGHVGRPGVYSLTGRKVTLKMAIAAAGGLDAVAIPRRCDLVRRVGNTEVTIQVDLQRIFDGEQPDIYLKPNDLVNIGTDMVAPFLAVTRNAYRASYGWGFTYDRNLYNQPVITQNQ